MNPTLHRTEWVSQEDWDEPTEHDVYAGFHPKGTNGDDTFVGRYDPTNGVTSVLNRLYEFRGGLIVERFLRENLRQNPALADVLIQVHAVIRDYFRSGTRIILEVVTDPEAPADQQLFVIVRTRLPRKVARELLSIVERGWWRSVPLAIRKKVELDLE